MTGASEPVGGEAAALLGELRAIARQAGAIIMAFYGGTVAPRTKADATPVTAADEAAEAAILPALRKLAPDLPVVSEEAGAAAGLPEPDRLGPRFWLVDPLDGTREFLTRTGEFTVNIALVEQGRPVLGVVLVPTSGVCYAGTIPGGATREESDGTIRPIAARRQPANGAIVLSSRSHGDAAALQAFLADEPVLAHRVAGSAVKFCLIAEGVADLYPRLGRTMEWDTAAGHAVLAAAGGSVTTLEGAELRYGKPGFANPHFVARGRR